MSTITTISVSEEAAHRAREFVNTVTDGAIRKRAKKDGWSRDLKAKIHAGPRGAPAH